LLEEGISTLEWVAIGLMTAAAAEQYVAAGLYSSAATFGDAEKQAKAVEATAQTFSTTASIVSTFASYERRKQDWEFQKSLGDQDVMIGD
jgi:hypothetical protein